MAGPLLPLPYNPRSTDFCAEPAMTLNDIKKDAQARMASASTPSAMTCQAAHGRASTALVDHLKVNYYGSDMRSRRCDGHTTDARTLTITPWEKAMSARREGDPRLRPRPDPEHGGTVIRINLPPLTEERRKNCPSTCPRGEKPRVAVATCAATRSARQGNVQGKDDHRGRDAQERGRDPEAHGSLVKDIDEVVKVTEQE